MHIFFPVLILIMATAAAALLIRQQKGPIVVTPSPSPATIRYVALGDSYTIGEGVSESERWPNLLAANLQQDGIMVSVVANIARTGWTTQDLIDRGLPLYESASPDYVTLQIGVNDWVQQVPTTVFRSRFRQILAHLLSKLPDTNRLLVVTIPDFGVTPTGKAFAHGRSISDGVHEFNEVIFEESAHVQVTVVDIFELSQGMAKDPGLINWDGLHPSAKEYRLWNQQIYPVALQQFN